MRDHVYLVKHHGQPRIMSNPTGTMTQPVKRMLLAAAHPHARMVQTTTPTQIPHNYHLSNSHSSEKKKKKTRRRMRGGLHWSGGGWHSPPRWMAAQFQRHPPQNESSTGDDSSPGNEDDVWGWLRCGLGRGDSCGVGMCMGGVSLIRMWLLT